MRSRGEKSFELPDWPGCVVKGGSLPTAPTGRGVSSWWKPVRVSYRRTLKPEYLLGPTGRGVVVVGWRCSGLKPDGGSSRGSSNWPGSQGVSSWWGGAARVLCPVVDRRRRSSNRPGGRGPGSASGGLAFRLYEALEILDGLYEAVVEGRGGGPAEFFLCEGYVGLPLDRVVRGQLTEDYL